MSPSEEKLVRELAIQLLDNEHGISTNAWSTLNILLLGIYEDNDDIIQAVECTEGRVYLPEGWNNTNG